MLNWRKNRGPLVTGGRSRTGWAFLAAALILAVLAGLLARYVLSLHAPARQVLVAARDLPPHTRLAESDLRRSILPPGGVPGDAVPNEGMAVGKVTRGLLLEGEVLRSGHMTSDTGGVLALQLRGSGLRAMALPGEVVGNLRDRIAPGDRLELVAVLPVRTEKQNTTVASQVAAGAQVLEVIRPEPDAPSDEKGSVLVAMTQEEAAKVALAVAGGRLFVTALPAGMERAPAMAPQTPEGLTAAGGR